MTSILLVAAIGCAAGALASPNSLPAAVWLAAASALTAACLYGLGGRTAAVLELSVGSGLVTILLVFAISLTGNIPDSRSTVPWPLAGALSLAALGLLTAAVLPLLPAAAPGTPQPIFTDEFWTARQLDVVVQTIILIATGLTLAGFLGTPARASYRQAESAPPARACPAGEIQSEAAQIPQPERHLEEV